MSEKSFWIASGFWENWDHTINHRPVRWGVKKFDIHLWQKLEPDDIVFCSASGRRPKPFKKTGFFMVGTVIRKYVLDKNDGYYPDNDNEGDRRASADAFLHRFEIKPLKIVFTDDELLPGVANLSYRKSINRVTNPSTKKELLKNLADHWNISLEVSNDSEKFTFEELVEKFDKDRFFFNPDRETEEERERERKKFVTDFPIEKIPLLTVEQYAPGKPVSTTGDVNRTTFCYRLEVNVPGFGRLHGPFARVFGIRYDKKKEKFISTKRKIPNVDVIFEEIKKEIVNLLNEGKKLEETGDWLSFAEFFEDQKFIIWRHWRSRILAIYYPKTFLAIHKEEAIDNILKGLDIAFDKKDYSSLKQSKLLEYRKQHSVMKNWSIQDYSHFVWEAVINKEEPPPPPPPDKMMISRKDVVTEIEGIDLVLDDICATINVGKNVILNGPPGTGKTTIAIDVARALVNTGHSKGYLLTTATSDWTTFDTIGGYMPGEKNSLKFEEGLFLQAISQNKTLIIDEINRADIDKAFGQLFTVLSGQGKAPQSLPFKVNGKQIKIKFDEDQNENSYDHKEAEYTIGNKWRIIATMNSYDKNSLFEMSFAFSRRWKQVFVDVPNEDQMRKLIDRWSDGTKINQEDNLIKLVEITKRRKIGPSIIKDIVYYLKQTVNQKSNPNFMNSIEGYILPQFEGIEDKELTEIGNNILEMLQTEEKQQFIRRFMEMFGIELKEN